MAREETFHPNFEDALAVQRVLDALERSALSRNWVRLDGNQQ
jgi:predicted dehydrogenase